MTLSTGSSHDTHKLTSKMHDVTSTWLDVLLWVFTLIQLGLHVQEYALLLWPRTTSTGKLQPPAQQQAAATPQQGETSKLRHRHGNSSTSQAVAGSLQPQPRPQPQPQPRGRLLGIITFESIYYATVTMVAIKALQCASNHDGQQITAEHWTQQCGDSSVPAHTFSVMVGGQPATASLAASELCQTMPWLCSAPWLTLALLAYAAAHTLPTLAVWLSPQQRSSMNTAAAAAGSLSSVSELVELLAPAQRDKPAKPALRATVFAALVTFDGLETAMLAALAWQMTPTIGF